MKKSGIFAGASLALLLLASGAISNAKHIVLYEKFTNTGCGPCARFAPGSDSLINMRLGELVSVTYHGWYPLKTDPFYLDTQEKGADARIGLYGITGYPSVILDGKQANASIGNIDKIVDQLIAEPQVADINLSCTFTDNVLKSKVSVKPIDDIDAADLRLFVAVMEEEVNLASAAPNGQTGFHYEFKTFMHNPDGIALAPVKAGGEAQDFEFSWDVVKHTDTSVTVQGVDNTDQIAVVAWIQDMISQKIYETAYSPRDSEYPNMAKVLKVSDTPQSICMPQYNAKIKFRNEGRNNLTSCNICIRINGTTQKTPWTGDIPFLGTVELTTPVFEGFDLNPTAKKNNVDIFISDINGSDAMSAIYTQAYENAVSGENAVELTVYSDNKPEEISWELSDETGTVIESSEPYTQKRTMVKNIFNLSKDGCYKLTFKDAGGDGIKGDYGNGWYKLSAVSAAGKKTTMVQTDYSGAEHVVNFSLVNASQAGLGNITSDTNGEMVYVGTTLTLGSDGYLTVTDAAGATQVSKNVNANESVDLCELPFGIYVVTLKTADTTFSKTLLIK